MPVRAGKWINGTPNEIVAPEVSGYVIHPTGTEAVGAPELLAVVSEANTTAVMRVRSGEGVLIDQ
jgi:hypothetical protein